MYVIKAEYLKKYPVYFQFPVNNQSEGVDFDPVAEIDKSSTFTKRAVADVFCKSISDFFSFHTNYHYDNVRVVEVKIQEVDSTVTYRSEEGWDQ